VGLYPIPSLGGGEGCFIPCFSPPLGGWESGLYPVSPSFGRLGGGFIPCFSSFGRLEWVVYTLFLPPREARRKVIPPVYTPG